MFFSFSVPLAFPEIYTLIGSRDGGKTQIPVHKAKAKSK
jgi:hypothetical protein